MAAVEGYRYAGRRWLASRTLQALSAGVGLGLVAFALLELLIELLPSGATRRPDLYSLFLAVLSGLLAVLLSALGAFVVSLGRWLRRAIRLAGPSREPRAAARGQAGEKSAAGTPEVPFAVGARRTLARGRMATALSAADCDAALRGLESPAFRYARLSERRLVLRLTQRFDYTLFGTLAPREPKASASRGGFEHQATVEVLVTASEGAGRTLLDVEFRFPLGRYVWDVFGAFVIDALAVVFLGLTILSLAFLPTSAAYIGPAALLGVGSLLAYAYFSIEAYRSAKFMVQALWKLITQRLDASPSPLAAG